MTLTLCIAQLVEAVKYTDCTSAEKYDSFNECSGYDTKRSDGEAPLMLEIWGIRNTSSLPLHPGPLWSRMVAPDRALSMG